MSRAILLCAGYATRMYPLTKRVAKPLLDVAGRPVLDYLLDELVRFPGLTEVHVVTNDTFASQFEAWAASKRPQLAPAGIQLVLHNDGVRSNESRLGAVGDLAMVLDRIGVEHSCLISAGDSIFQTPLQSIWERFLQTEENLLPVLHETNRARLRRSGVVELDTDDRVLALHEKPEDPVSNWISPAMYCWQPSALARVQPYLEAGGASDAPGHFAAHIVEEERVRALRLAGSRFDIGSMNGYEAANRALAAGSQQTGAGQDPDSPTR